MLERRIYLFTSFAPLVLLILAILSTIRSTVKVLRTDRVATVVDDELATAGRRLASKKLFNLE